MKTPNPATKEAIEQGCKCPIHGNKLTPLINECPCPNADTTECYCDTEYHIDFKPKYVTEEKLKQAIDKVLKDFAETFKKLADK